MSLTQEAIASDTTDWLSAALQEIIDGDRLGRNRRLP